MDNLLFKTGNNGQVNVDQAQGIVECFVAGIGNKDSVGDIVISGAFAKSLTHRKPRVVWGHSWNDPIGKVLEMYEVPVGDSRLPAKMRNAGIGGLYAKVQFNLQSEKGKEAFATVAFFGEDQEWSIGYKTIDSVFDQALQANILKEVELYEVSPVLHGANQLTGTISIKTDEKAHMPIIPIQGSGMPVVPAMTQVPRIVVVAAPDKNTDDSSIGNPFAEGMSRELSQPDKMALQAELAERTGSKIEVMNATENIVVFRRTTSDGKASMYRLPYHNEGGQFMFGKPEPYEADTQTPQPMQNIEQKPGAPVVVPNGGIAYRNDDQQEMMGLFENTIESPFGKSEISHLIELPESYMASAKDFVNPVLRHHKLAGRPSAKGIIIDGALTANALDALQNAVKALGATIGQMGGNIGQAIGKIRDLAQTFNPYALDGDGDGFVQDGSAFQRPYIPIKKPGFDLPDVRGRKRSGDKLLDKPKPTSALPKDRNKWTPAQRQEALVGGLIEPETREDIAFLANRRPENEGLAKYWDMSEADLTKEGNKLINARKQSAGADKEKIDEELLKVSHEFQRRASYAETFGQEFVPPAKREMPKLDLVPIDITENESIARMLGAPKSKIPRTDEGFASRYDKYVGKFDDLVEQAELDPSTEWSKLDEDSQIEFIKELDYDYMYDVHGNLGDDGLVEAMESGEYDDEIAEFAADVWNTIAEEKKLATDKERRQLDQEESEDPRNIADAEEAARIEREELEEERTERFRPTMAELAMEAEADDEIDSALERYVDEIPFGDEDDEDGFASSMRNRNLAPWEEFEPLVSYAGGVGDPTYVDELSGFVVDKINNDSRTFRWIREQIATEYLPNAKPGSEEFGILKGIADGEGINYEDYKKLPEKLLDDIDEFAADTGEYGDFLTGRERDRFDGFASRGEPPIDPPDPELSDEFIEDYLTDSLSMGELDFETLEKYNNSDVNPLQRAVILDMYERYTSDDPAVSAEAVDEILKRFYTELVDDNYDSMVEAKNYRPDFGDDGFASRGEPFGFASRDDDGEIKQSKLDEMVEDVKTKLIAELETADPSTWKPSWRNDSLPINPTTGKPYRGFNAFWLMMRTRGENYSTGRFAGFNQLKARGAQVRKGEKGVPILRPQLVKKEDDDGNVREFVVFRGTTVFNIDQADGGDEALRAIPADLPEEQRIKILESTIAELGVNVVTDNMRGPHYSPTGDYVSMPDFSKGTSALDWNSSLAHETIHWTGGASRLNRPSVANYSNDSKTRAYEELVAEIGSAMFLAAHGIDAPFREDHAPYIKGWISLLKDDPDALSRAFKDATAAINHILEKSPNLRKLFGGTDSGKKAPEVDAPDLVGAAVNSSEGFASLHRVRTPRSKALGGILYDDTSRELMVGFLKGKPWDDASPRDRDIFIDRAEAILTDGNRAPSASQINDYAEELYNDARDIGWYVYSDVDMTEVEELAIVRSKGKHINALKKLKKARKATDEDQFNFFGRDERITDVASSKMNNDGFASSGTKKLGIEPNYADPTWIDKTQRRILKQNTDWSSLSYDDQIDWANSFLQEFIEENEMGHDLTDLMNGRRLNTRPDIGLMNYAESAYARMSDAHMARRAQFGEEDGFASVGNRTRRLGMQPSEAVDYVAYDPDSESLFVAYKRGDGRGDMYVYEGVSMDDAVALENAPSAGRAINDIKRRKDVRKATPDEVIKLSSTEERLLQAIDETDAVEAKLKKAKLDQVVDALGDKKEIARFLDERDYQFEPGRNEPQLRIGERDDSQFRVEYDPDTREYVVTSEYWDSPALGDRETPGEWIERDEARFDNLSDAVEDIKSRLSARDADDDEEAKLDRELADITRELDKAGDMPGVESIDVTYSSALNAVDYNPATKEMRVSYNGGGTYIYEGVDVDEVEAFKAAPSKGRAINDIKRAHPFRQDSEWTGDGDEDGGIEEFDVSGSAAVEQVSYDPEKEDLMVIYSGGRGYVYTGVTREEADAVRSAPSKGRAINDVKRTHEVRNLTGEDVRFFGSKKMGELTPSEIQDDKELDVDELRAFIDEQEGLLEVMRLNGESSAKLAQQKTIIDNAKRDLLAADPAPAAKPKMPTRKPPRGGKRVRNRNVAVAMEQGTLDEIMEAESKNISVDELRNAAGSPMGKYTKGPRKGKNRGPDTITVRDAETGELLHSNEILLTSSASPGSPSAANRKRGYIRARSYAGRQGHNIVSDEGPSLRGEGKGMTDYDKRVYGLGSDEKNREIGLASSGGRVRERGSRISEDINDFRRYLDSEYGEYFMEYTQMDDEELKQTLMTRYRMSRGEARDLARQIRRDEKYYYDLWEQEDLRLNDLDALDYGDDGFASGPSRIRRIPRSNTTPMSVQKERGTGYITVSAMVTGGRGASEEDRGTRRMQITFSGGSPTEAKRNFLYEMDDRSLVFAGEDDGFASMGQELQDLQSKIQRELINPGSRNGKRNKPIDRDVAANLANPESDAGTLVYPSTNEGDYIRISYNSEKRKYNVERIQTVRGFNRDEPPEEVVVDSADADTSYDAGSLVREFAENYVNDLRSSEGLASGNGKKLILPEEYRDYGLNKDDLVDMLKSNDVDPDEAELIANLWANSEEVWDVYLDEALGNVDGYMGRALPDAARNAYEDYLSASADRLEDRRLDGFASRGDETAKAGISNYKEDKDYIFLSDDNKKIVDAIQEAIESGEIDEDSWKDLVRNTLFEFPNSERYELTFGRPVNWEDIWEDTSNDDIKYDYGWGAYDDEIEANWFSRVFDQADIEDELRGLAELYRPEGSTYGDDAHIAALRKEWFDDSPASGISDGFASRGPDQLRFMDLDKVKDWSDLSESDQEEWMSELESDGAFELGATLKEMRTIAEDAWDERAARQKKYVTDQIMRALDVFEAGLKDEPNKERGANLIDGSSFNLIRELINPDRADVADYQEALRLLEDTRNRVNRYLNRRSQDNNEDGFASSGSDLSDTEKEEIIAVAKTMGNRYTRSVVNQYNRNGDLSKAQWNALNRMTKRFDKEKGERVRNTALIERRNRERSAAASSDGFASRGFDLGMLKPTESERASENRGRINLAYDEVNLVDSEDSLLDYLDDQGYDDFSAVNPLNGAEVFVGEGVSVEDIAFDGNSEDIAAYYVIPYNFAQPNSKQPNPLSGVDGALLVRGYGDIDADRNGEPKRFTRFELVGEYETIDDARSDAQDYADNTASSDGFASRASINESSTGQRIVPSRMHSDDREALAEITDPEERKQRIDELIEFYGSRIFAKPSKPKRKPRPSDTYDSDGFLVDGDGFASGYNMPEGITRDNDPGNQREYPDDLPVDDEFLQNVIIDGLSGEELVSLNTGAETPLPDPNNDLAERWENNEINAQDVFDALYDEIVDKYSDELLERARSNYDFDDYDDSEPEYDDDGFASRGFVEEIDVSGSSAVERVSYDPDKEELLVVYEGGNGYIYSGVTPEEVSGLKYAPSKGRAINDIKRTHDVRKQELLADGLDFAERDYNFDRLTPEDQKMYLQRALANNADSGMNTEQILEEAKKLAMDDREMAQLERQAVGMGASSEPRKIDVSSSSALNHVAYDEKNRVLEVEYRGRDGKGTGTLYKYQDVEPDLVDRIEAADSRGATLREVRDNYEFTTSRRLPDSAYEGLASRGSRRSTREMSKEFDKIEVLDSTLNQMDPTEATEYREQLINARNQAALEMVLANGLDPKKIDSLYDVSTDEDDLTVLEKYDAAIDDADDRLESLRAVRSMAEAKEQASAYALNEANEVYTAVRNSLRQPRRYFDSDEDFIEYLRDNHDSLLGDVQSFVLGGSDGEGSDGLRAFTLEHDTYLSSDDASLLDGLQKRIDSAKTEDEFDAIRADMERIMGELVESHEQLYREDEANYDYDVPSVPDDDELKPSKLATFLKEQDAENYFVGFPSRGGDGFASMYPKDELGLEQFINQQELELEDYTEMSRLDPMKYPPSGIESTKKRIATAKRDLARIQKNKPQPVEEEEEFLESIDGFASRGRRRQGRRGRRMAPVSRYSAEDRQALADGNILRSRKRPGKRRQGPSVDEFDGFASRTVDELPDTDVPSTGVPFEGGEHGPGKDISLKKMWENYRKYSRRRGRTPENDRWQSPDVTIEEAAKFFGVDKNVAAKILQARDPKSPELFIDDPYLASEIGMKLGFPKYDKAEDLFGFEPLSYYDDEGNLLSELITDQDLENAVEMERARRAARIAAREGRKVGKSNLIKGGATIKDLEDALRQIDPDIKLTNDDGVPLSPGAMKKAIDALGIEIPWSAETYRKIQREGGALSPNMIQYLVNRDILDPSFNEMEDMTIGEALQWPGFAKFSGPQMINALSDALGISREEIAKSQRTIGEALTNARNNRRQAIRRANIRTASLKLTKEKIAKMIENLGLSVEDFEKWRSAPIPKK